MRVPLDQRIGIFDSMAVQTSDSSLLVGSDAWIHILRRLGGAWKVMAALVAVIPPELRVRMYNFIARIRYRVFGQRDDMCPVIAPELRDRFEL